jgi:hypothetical protein
MFAHAPPRAQSRQRTGSLPSTDSSAANRHSPNAIHPSTPCAPQDRNGRLTSIELQSALQLGGLNFSLATVAHIIRIHDRQNSGSITFEEFTKLHEFLTNVQVCVGGVVG